jgi:hypothetical protein
MRTIVWGRPVAQVMLAFCICSGLLGLVFGVSLVRGDIVHGGNAAWVIYSCVAMILLLVAMLRFGIVIGVVAGIVSAVIAWGVFAPSMSASVDIHNATEGPVRVLLVRDSDGVYMQEEVSQDSSLRKTIWAGESIGEFAKCGHEVVVLTEGGEDRIVLDQIPTGGVVTLRIESGSRGGIRIVRPGS